MSRLASWVMLVARAARRRTSRPDMGLTARPSLPLLTRLLSFQIRFKKGESGGAVIVTVNLLTKAVTSPFRYLFGKANSGIAAPIRIVGKTCVITTSEVTPRFGQAQMEQEGAPITLNVRCRADVRLGKGDEAVITEHDTDTDTYFVYPFDLEVKS